MRVTRWLVQQIGPARCVYGTVALAVVVHSYMVAS